MTADDRTRRVIEDLRKRHEMYVRMAAQTRGQMLSLMKQLPTTQEGLPLFSEPSADVPAPIFTPQVDDTAKPKKRRESGAPTAQPDLVVEEEIFVLDDADRTCPRCGDALRELAGQFEESELIDVIEVRYRVLKAKRQKYGCHCGCIDTAIGPERAIPGGRYSLAFAAKVAVDKYLDHLPLERQSRIMERHGLRVASQTLWDQCKYLADELQPISDALLRYALSLPVIGIDQTHWRCLEKNATRQWQMWCIAAPGVVVHRIRDDKSAATFVDLVGDYAGIIVGDAAAAHLKGVRDGPATSEERLAGCWAHAYRKFEEAVPDHPAAQYALDEIGELYAIDDEAGDDLARKAVLRREQSTVVLARLHQWCSLQAVLPSLALGRAMHYMVSNWQRLNRFIDDPRIPLDNNHTERGQRGPVVGRKNHYGSKSRKGTEVASTLYSLLETAKLHTRNPAGYLVAADFAARRGEILLPWDWQPGTAE